MLVKMFLPTLFLSVLALLHFLHNFVSRRFRGTGWKGSSIFTTLSIGGFPYFMLYLLIVKQPFEVTRESSGRDTGGQEYLGRLLGGGLHLLPAPHGPAHARGVPLAVLR